MSERPQDTDAEYLRSIARGLSYNASTDECVRKHRLNEIAARIQTGFYDLPISATQPASPARDDVLETLRELVVGLDITHWSSWQTTAYFWDQLEAARRLLEDRALREQG